MADPSDYQKDPRPATQSQLSTSLPGPSVLITSHNESGKSILHSKREGSWGHMADNQMGFNPIFMYPNNPDLSEEKDIKESDEVIAKTGLVREGGTIARHVDFAPGYECGMHRTVSVDFGIVVEGSIEMVLDDGSSTLMRIGDVAVQRQTMHAWRNPSKDRWARMVFILQEAQPLKLGEETLGEDLGQGVGAT